MITNAETHLKNTLDRFSLYQKQLGVLIRTAKSSEVDNPILSVFEVKTLDLSEFRNFDSSITSNLFLAVNDNFILTTDLIDRFERQNMRLLGTIDRKLIFLNCKYYSIDNLTFKISFEHDTFTLTIPELFLGTNRFDLGLKILTGGHLHESACRWAKDLYARHLYWITGAGKEIREHGNLPEKTGLPKFIDTFNGLISSFDSLPSPVPVNSHGVLQNGAHRVSAAIISQKVIAFQKVEYDRKIHASQEFFTRKLISTKRLRKHELELSLRQLYKLKLDLEIIVLFPNSKKKSHILREIKEEMDVLGFSSFYAYGKLPEALMNICYSNNENYTNNKGASGRSIVGLRDRFLRTGRVHIFVVQPKSPSSVRTFKSKLRSKYQLSNGSLHSADSYVEGLNLCDIAFSPIDRFVRRLNGLSAMEYRTEPLIALRKYNIPLSQVCIVGSSVLEILGIRKSRDLDLIVHTTQLYNFRLSGFDLHNESFLRMGLNPDDLIHDPSNYFTVNGIKFLNPKILLKFKMRRGELKDIKDAYLLAIWFAKGYLVFLRHHFRKFPNTLRFIKNVSKKLV